LRSPLPESYAAAMRRSDGEGFIGFWEAMARDEIERDPRILGSR
jgi:hypothetical protein